MNDYLYALALVVGTVWYKVDKLSRSLWYNWKYRKEHREMKRKYLK